MTSRADGAEPARGIASPGRHRPAWQHTHDYLRVIGTHAERQTRRVIVLTAVMMVDGSPPFGHVPPAAGIAGEAGMRAWIGKSIVAIGIVHNLFGSVVGYEILAGMVREGLLNTVVTQYDRNAAFWFLFTGFALMLLGALIDWCERTIGKLPRFVGPSFLALTVAGVAIMPQSGFWLLFVPTIGLLARRRRPQP